jgi:hypothetical protein
VTPMSVRAPFPAMQGFRIYDDKLVLVDTLSSELSLRYGEDVQLYIRHFERLWERKRGR